MLPNCDCGTCCAQCGHYADCSVYDDTPRVDLAKAIANPRPGSFLEWMLQGSDESDAA